MKKQWYGPKITEILVELTEGTGTEHGSDTMNGQGGAGGKPGIFNDGHGVEGALS